MSKQIIVSRMAEETGLSQNVSSEIYDTVVNIVQTEVAKLSVGESFNLFGIAIFTKKMRAERKGHNVATGEEIVIPAREVVTAKASNAIKKGV